ncbi:MAG TPA: hypothetical protein VE985_04945 [Gaiellaceae bacterium]|nr:hypothetical protein [Gaiellaceae bacterium]
MSGVPTRVLAAAVVVGAALTATLVGPSLALACNGGTSAVNVYKECLPSGGAGKSKAHEHSRAGHQGTNRAGSTPSHLSGRATKALSHAGKDKSALTKLIKSYGQRRRLQASGSGSQQSPSAVGSAFDLGSGPTALLIVLASGAFLLLGASGLRGWRRWHRG